MTNTVLISFLIDVTIYCKRCGHFYRYQEWAEGLHNFDDHTILTLHLCLFLRQSVKVIFASVFMQIFQKTCIPRKRKYEVTMIRSMANFYRPKNLVSCNCNSCALHVLNDVICISFRLCKGTCPLKPMQGEEALRSRVHSKGNGHFAGM